MALGFISNIYFWITLALVFLCLFIVLLILIIVIAKKTHAMVEFRAWLSGKPICLFFQENRYCHWEAIESEAGIITHKNYGAFVVNEKATYIDKRTKNILIPFDAAFGAGINIHAAKLADDLQYIMKDDEQVQRLREMIASGQIDDTETIMALKTSVSLGAMKNMMTALIPHNINAKIEKIIASRMKSYGQINVWQIVLIFVAVLGAIILGMILIKVVFNKG